MSYNIIQYLWRCCEDIVKFETINRLSIHIKVQTSGRFINILDFFLLQIPRLYAIAPIR